MERAPVWIHFGDQDLVSGIINAALELIQPKMVDFLDLNTFITKRIGSLRWVR